MLRKSQASCSGYFPGPIYSTTYNLPLRLYSAGLMPHEQPQLGAWIDRKPKPKLAN